MIEAKDLRIGNWVEYTPFTGIPEFTEINVFNLADLSGQTDIAKPEWKERYKSIPLTTEILLKCGFKKSEIEHIDGFPFDLQVLNYYRFEWYASEFSIVSSDEYYNFHDAAPVKFVHQLQNLYYVLKGNELEIKL